MKINSITLAIAAMVVALGGCNRVDNDRTTSVPRGVDRAAMVDQAPTGLSAPPAPAERGPIPADANAAAPGTNATLAMANQPAPNGSAQSEPGVAAQEAAAKAPDTASADEAKKQVMDSMMASNTVTSNMTGSMPTARDTELNSPRHGTLTPQQNSTELPKAGQVNNHSSTALEKDSGR